VTVDTSSVSLEDGTLLAVPSSQRTEIGSCRTRDEGVSPGGQTSARHAHAEGSYSGSCGRSERD